jgi:GT2 family glycosyltransferase
MLDGMALPRVCAVVLSWNGLADTLECLGSIRGVDYPGLQVVVVDNGSQDGSAAAVRATYPEVTVIENGRNLGYAGGNNVGIRHALGTGAEYIWLLNNDTALDPGCLRALVDAAGATPRCGLVTPRVLDYDERDHRQQCGAVLDLVRGEMRAIEGPDVATAQDGRLLLVWGVAMLFPRAVPEQVGFLHEGYFAYFEDAEFSLRAARAARENAMVPSAVVYHKRARSLGGLRAPTRVYLMTRNEYHFWHDALRGRARRARLRGQAADAIASALELRRAGHAEAAEACLEGTWDGIRRVFGPRRPGARVPGPVRWLMARHPYLSSNLLQGRYREVLGAAFRRAGPSGDRANGSD